MNRRTDPKQADSPRALGDAARRILVTDVVPFWERSVDRQQGGYRLNHDANGQWRGPADKYLVTQARTLWYFSRLARELVCGEGADIGYRFMQDGESPEPQKRRFLLGGRLRGSATHQARQAPLRSSVRTVRAMRIRIDNRATGSRRALSVPVRDRRPPRLPNQGQLGYREWFSVDWRQPPKHHVGHLGAPPDHKLFNTHLHLLEAITSFVQLDGDGLPGRRLDELIEVCGWSCVRRMRTPGAVATSSWKIGARCEDLSTTARRTGTTWKTSPSYFGQPGCSGPWRRSSFGDVARFAGTPWPMAVTPSSAGSLRAARSARRPTGARRSTGFRPRRFLGCCGCGELTGEPGYLESLRHTLDWVDGMQVDRAGGDWHGVIAPTGTTAWQQGGSMEGPLSSDPSAARSLALADHPAEPSVPGV